MKAPVLFLFAAVALSAVAWEGPKLTVAPDAPKVTRTWADVKAAVQQSIAKTGDGYFCYSRRYNDLGPIDTSGTLTAEELKTQFALACILASPITVNGPAPSAVAAWLGDKMLMNVNGDLVGRQGHVVVERDGVIVLKKYLWDMNAANGAVAFYNPTDAAKTISVDARELELSGPVKWTDRFDPTRTGTFANSFSVTLAPHASRLYHMSGKAMMRSCYRAACARTVEAGRVFECVFVPKTGDYRLLVETDGREPVTVNVNGLIVGTAKGVTDLAVKLYAPENRVLIMGPGAADVTAIRLYDAASPLANITLALRLARAGKDYQSNAAIQRARAVKGTFVDPEQTVDGEMRFALEWIHDVFWEWEFDWLWSRVLKAEGDLAGALEKIGEKGCLRYKKYGVLPKSARFDAYCAELKKLAAAEPDGTWLRHRISRNWRTPINRPPLNHDELMDDVDYYPEAYLREMAHDRVNGLWISAKLDVLSESPQRLKKLKATAEKTARYGIGIWLMFNDPIATKADDPRVLAHPEMFGPGPVWSPSLRTWCPSSPATLDYIRRATAKIFRAVPELAGIVNISHGEGFTTCLSRVNADRDPFDWVDTPPCARCAHRAPADLHRVVAEAFVAGMRAGNPAAEYVSWLYHPSVKTERADWVPDIARHLPAGCTLAYNFESGCVKEQLGRRHVGGDYWLSEPGPGAPFAAVAKAAREAHAPLAAKIQVSTSHEMATLPYIPAPGLLYRKYRAMRREGVTSVLQCWYFGNMPGIMNKAAGWLASVDFETEDERTFLRRLAADDWGEDAPTLERIWSAYTAAYEDYPFDNSMQYYGPFAAGVVWPLAVEPELKPLARTWIATEPVSGDFIGECLREFSVDEAEKLTARMTARVESVRGELDALAKKYVGNAARTRDIGVMKAFCNQIGAAHGVFAFYRARRDGDRATMVRIAEEELKRTDEMIALAEADERLGWHSEAEWRLYSPERLRARRPSLEAVVRTQAKSTAPRGCDAVYGRETVGSNLVWKAELVGADCIISGTVSNVAGLVVSATDDFGTVYPKSRHLAVTNGPFRVTIKNFHPDRLLFLSDTYPQQLYCDVLWPVGRPRVLNRLLLPWSCGPSFGRISSPP